MHMGLRLEDLKSGDIGRPTDRLEELKEMEWGCVHWISLVQDRKTLWAHVKTVVTVGLHKIRSVE
jgi:hypothetical protein